MHHPFSPCSTINVDDAITAFNGPFVQPRNNTVMDTMYDDAITAFNGPFVQPRNNTVMDTMYDDAITAFNGPFVQPRNNTVMDTMYDDAITAFNGPFVQPRNNTVMDTMYDDAITAFNGPFVQPRNNTVMDTMYDDAITAFNGPFVQPRNNTVMDTMYDDAINITEKAIGLGKITYLDIPSSLKGHDDWINNSAIKLNYGKTLELINPTPLDHTSPTIKDIFKKIVASFKDVKALGNATIYANSLLFPDNYESLKLQIITNNNEKYHLKNVSSLNINGNKKLELDIINSSLLIANGKGLYSNIFIDKIPSIEYSSPKMSIHDSQNQSIPYIKVTADGATFKIENVSNISILNNGPIHVYARQPQVDISGNITLTQLKTNLQYSKTGYIPGNNLDISGKISLSIYLSDTIELRKYPLYR